MRLAFLLLTASLGDTQAHCTNILARVPILSAAAPEQWRGRGEQRGREGGKEGRRGGVNEYEAVFFFSFPHACFRFFFYFLCYPA